MSWSIGYDSNWNRDIGYGVPAICDHPSCKEKIDRGLSYVCGGEPYGGKHGCGLHFCYTHLLITEKGQLCARCASEKKPFDPKPDLPEWVIWKLKDTSWQEWRNENQSAVILLKKSLFTPRNMSFSMTTKQYIAHTKTVTRRLGWWGLQPGDVLNGVKKAMGLKKGEKIEVLGRHRIINADPEPLNAITREDVIREGFPKMTPEEFIAFFLKGHKCPDGPSTIVNRIEFKYL